MQRKYVFNQTNEGKLGFNTASGKHCCNDEKGGLLREGEVVSIPQAVSTVATNAVLEDNSRFKSDHVSIPQAVSTVATNMSSVNFGAVTGFNTASGKHCCN